MANISQKKIVSLPEPLRKEVKQGLKEHGKVKIVGLGIFETKEIPARRGRNPQTGGIMMIGKYKKIKFRATKSLNLYVN